MSVNMDELLEELIVAQRKKIKAITERFSLKLTPEDLRNPQDYVELKESPYFNYEDGYLNGLIAAQMAIRNKVKNP